MNRPRTSSPAPLTSSVARFHFGIGRARDSVLRMAAAETAFGVVRINFLTLHYIVTETVVVRCRA